MRFQQKIKTLASNNGAIPYVFGSMAQLNVILDKLNSASNYPVCVHVQSVDGSMSSFPAFVEEQSLAIGYADRIPLDFDAESVEAQADTLRAMCRAFVSRLNNDGAFAPVEEYDYSVMFDTMDANLILVLMTMKVRQSVGEC